MSEDTAGFGWKDSVEVPDGEYALVPEGPAAFEVLKRDRQRKEFGQFGVCNVAVVTLAVASESGGATGEVTVQFPLVLKMGWKILQLATACGFRKRGESNEIDPRWWEKFPGASGRCVIAHRKYPKRGESKDKSQSATWTGVGNEVAEFTAAGETEF
jgi:hypothetical protein